MLLRSFKLRRHEEHVWIMPRGAGTGVTLRGEAAARAFALGAPLFALAHPAAPERVRALSVDLATMRMLATVDLGGAKPTPVRLDGPPVAAALPDGLLGYLAARCPPPPDATEPEPSPG